MKLVLHLLRAFTVLYILIALLFLYLYFVDGRNVLVYKNLPFPTDKTTYHAGDSLGVIRTGCADRNLVGTVNVSVVDGFVLNFAPFQMNRIKGCVTKEGMELRVPNLLPPGVYHLQGETTIKVNLILTESIPWTSQPFTIIK